MPITHYWSYDSKASKEGLKFSFRKNKSVSIITIINHHNKNKVDGLSSNCNDLLILHHSCASDPARYYKIQTWTLRIHII